MTSDDVLSDGEMDPDGDGAGRRVKGVPSACDFPAPEALARRQGFGTVQHRSLVLTQRVRHTAFGANPATVEPDGLGAQPADLIQLMAHEHDRPAMRAHVLHLPETLTLERDIRSEERRVGK